MGGEHSINWRILLSLLELNPRKYLSLTRWGTNKNTCGTVSDPVKNPFKHGCFVWVWRRRRLPQIDSWISGAVFAHWPQTTPYLPVLAPWTADPEIQGPVCDSLPRHLPHPTNWSVSFRVFLCIVSLLVKDTLVEKSFACDVGAWAMTLSHIFVEALSQTYVFVKTESWVLESFSI